MTIPTDPITRKKLILVKQLYQQAVIQSASPHSIIGRMMSIIEFDLASETVLRALVIALDSSKTPADGFQSLVQQVDDLLSKAGMGQIPDKANILHVRSIRNDAQHKAKYPNESDVDDCRIYTRDFLNKICEDVWKIEFEKISLTDIIQYSKVKDSLIFAESELSLGHYKEAVHAAVHGLDQTFKNVRAAIGGRIPDSEEFMLEHGGSGKDVYIAFKRMQDMLMYLALGMNYADYERFMRTAGSVVGIIDGHYFPGIGNVDRSDAEYIVAYCINMVVQIESQVGDLGQPFGIRLE